MHHTGERTPSHASASTSRPRGLGAPPAPTSQDRVAACVGPQARWFFSDDAFQIAQAKKLCGTCPAQEDCLAGALERREPCGVWGGQLLHNGVAIRALPTRGRPRKNRLAGRPPARAPHNERP